MDDFALVKHSHVKKCKLFNEATMRYLCLSEAGFTTTLNPGEDLKANFYLHFYHTLDNDRRETQLVVPVHSTLRCLAMLPDKKLGTSKKNVLKPERVKKADNTFFYYKAAGSPERVVFEGMNGKTSDSNYYLAVNPKNNRLQLVKKEGENYLSSMVFVQETQD